MTWRRSLLSLLFFIATAARALVDVSADNETYVRQMIDAREQIESAHVSRLDTRTRLQTAAIERVERLRTLPPEQIQDWVAGRLTEADLMAMPRETATSSAVPKTDSLLSAAFLPSPASMVRMLTVGALCVITALMMLRKKKGRGRI